MAKKDLVRLLARLYGDPEAERQFQRDRAKFLLAQKLSPREQRLLVDGDVGGLRSYLGDECDKLTIVDSALGETAPSRPLAPQKPRAKAPAQRRPAPKRPKPKKS